MVLLLSIFHKKSSMYKLNIFQGRNKEYYWNIKASNGQIIATSGEGFTKKYNCKESVKKLIEAFRLNKIDDSNIKT